MAPILQMGHYPAPYIWKIIGFFAVPSTFHSNKVMSGNDPARLRMDHVLQIYLYTGSALRANCHCFCVYIYLLVSHFIYSSPAAVYIVYTSCFIPYTVCVYNTRAVLISYMLITNHDKEHSFYCLRVI